jgi:hypothetical protein
MQIPVKVAQFSKPINSLANSSHSAVELNRERRPSSSCSVLLKFRPGHSVDGTGNTRSKAQVRVC